MAKWKDTIPLNPDDLKLLEADKLAHDIEGCFDQYDAPIKIKKKGYDPRYGDGFKFEVNLIGGTKVGKVRSLVETIQYKLRLPALEFLQENGILYFTTSTSRPVTLNNNLKQIFEMEEYKLAFREMGIAHPVGVDEDGNVIIRDLKEYPQALVSGTTNSGKSTALKCLLVSLRQYFTNDVNLIIADWGGELTRFRNLPHLSCPIIREPETLARMFLRLKDEMERRNVLWQENDPRLSKHPYIVCVIDEFQLFIDGINQRKGSEIIVKTINDILRYGRHTKIHLILAIHDPKNDIAVIEKGDLATQLTFQTVDSRKSITALGEAGAEKLCGEGDMIFRHKSKSYHLKGVFMSDDEIDLELNKPRISSCAIQSPDGTWEDYRFSISDEDLQENEESVIDLSFISSMKETPNSEDENERKFTTIALWTLTQSVISINSIQHCGIFQNGSAGNDFAKKCFERLRSFEILGDKDSKGRLMVIPQSVEEVPGELKELLSRYGISNVDIAEAISKRPKQ